MEWDSRKCPRFAFGRCRQCTNRDSLCRFGNRFPGVCIPRMESITVPARTCLWTSPTLVGDPSDATRSNCSLSDLRVVWPGSQRVNLLKC
ncbi:hypothetical protein GHT06_021477 [Daphnia sinensis]|uniref:Uncharacterized protein n=1 Tax=Daphnia sinensis TaxID=1820382 RepID=A0AAD5PQV3_9CRUS|nr:hypothetical protein GHT06_021477 [Daphnia sinensis]